MKKLTLLTLAIFGTALISCTNSQGDSFGYVTPPPTERNYSSNEAGALQQPGGVAAEIEAEQGNPSDNSFISVRE